MPCYTCTVSALISKENIDRWRTLNYKNCTNSCINKVSKAEYTLLKLHTNITTYKVGTQSEHLWKKLYKQQG